MELLKKLTQCAAPSGREDGIREIIENELKDTVDEIYTDALGNLICHKKGNGKKLMLASHMDEIGFFVTFIDDNGFLRFAPIGGMPKYNCISTRVVFRNGTVGTISFESKEDPLKVGFDKMYIDIGASSRKEAEEKVNIGDMAVWVSDMVLSGDKIISKALDDRAGCYALICALKELSSSPNDIYAVFTAQEELGLRGARTSANSIEPDMAVALDVSIVGDTPQSHDFSLALGQGPSIKCMDRSFIIHPSVRKFLTDCANIAQIPFQLEAASVGGTDAGAIHLSGSGVPSGTISIPTRYIHSPNEVISAEDLKNTVEFVKQMIKTDISKYLEF